MYTAPKRIEQLRKEGWTVKVRIERALVNEPLIIQDHLAVAALGSRADGYTGKDFRPRGGRTLVTLIAPDGKQVMGESKCHPLLDNFNKKIGLEAALGRALKEHENGD